MPSDPLREPARAEKRNPEKGRTQMGLPSQSHATWKKKHFQVNEGPAAEAHVCSKTPSKNGLTYTLELKRIWEARMIINYF